MDPSEHTSQSQHVKDEPSARTAMPSRFPSAQISSIRSTLSSNSTPNYRSPIPGHVVAGQGMARSDHTSPQALRTLSPRLRFYDRDTFTLACINCAPLETSVSPLPPKTNATTSSPNPIRQGPLLVELRKLVLNPESVVKSVSPSLFSTRSLCQARGNPSLGSSVTSTCLSVAHHHDIQSSGQLPLVATGLSTGALCIHNFSSKSNGADRETTAWQASTEYYHVPRVQRSATAVEWRPDQSHQVAIGLTAGGGPSELRQQTQQGLRLAVAAGSVTGAGSTRASHTGDRDYCCFIWDIEHQSASSTARRTSKTAHPIYRLAHQTGVASLGWLLDGGQVLVLGTQHRNLQVYDLRMQGANAPISVYAHNFGVHGVRADPTRPWQFATFSKAAGETVKLWDVRRMETTSATEIKIQSPFTSSPVVDVVKWSPSGTLSVLTGDGYMHLYDTSGSRPVCTSTLFTSGQIEDVAYFPGMDSKSSHCADASKPIHQLLAKRLVVVRRDQTIGDVPMYRAAPLAVSRRPGNLIRAHGHALLVNNSVMDSAVDESRPFLEDISTIMMRRTGTSKGSTRYSMNIDLNISLLKKEIENAKHECERETVRQLVRLWRWIQRVEHMSDEIATDRHSNLGFKSLGDAGAIRLLGTRKDESETTTFSESVLCDVYESDARRMAVASCGWAGDLGLPVVMTKCEEVGEYERSAALAVWHGEIEAAVEALQRGSEVTNDASRCEAMDLVALSIAGYSGREATSGIWTKACTILLQRPELSGSGHNSCYLRHALLFLMTQKKHQDVIEDPHLSLCDRVAFACRYLAFEPLLEYLTGLVDDCMATGNIEGVSITGLNQTGIKIMQSYVDATTDVQSAAIVTSRVLLPPDWNDERKIVAEWLQEYRILLNQWQMWQSRAMFDVQRSDLLRKQKARQENGQTNNNIKRRYHKGPRQGLRKPDPDIPIRAQLEARCNYCSAPLALLRQESRAWQSKMKGVITCCPSCRKPLPRCAICMLPLGALNPFVQLTKGGVENESLAKLPFAEWFSWCLRCKHGGHAHHLIKWFDKHEVCPVNGCDCHCQFDGYEEDKMS